MSCPKPWEGSATSQLNAGIINFMEENGSELLSPFRKDGIQNWRTGVTYRGQGMAVTNTVTNTNPLLPVLSTGTAAGMWRELPNLHVVPKLCKMLISVTWKRLKALFLGPRRSLLLSLVDTLCNCRFTSLVNSVIFKTCMPLKFLLDTVFKT